MSDDAAVYTAWSRRHAALMLAVCAVSAAWGRPWPLVLAALPSFGVWMWRSRRTFTPRGDFGAGNAVTALRLAMTLALGVAGRDTPGMALAAALVLQALLDAADGWFARRLGEASAFGAAFDMETDALLILIADLQLWQRGRLGVWILSAGLLRYAYVLTLAMAPPPAGPVPRSRLGRYAFLALLGGLTAAFARADVIGTALAALGTTAVVVSFAQSFWWSYRRG
jgi:phosphatidylglycerophosphate synthase